MAKGQAAKQEVIATILSTFPDSFLYNGGKEVRINTSEGGEPVQIKITLTAAKNIVTEDGETAVPTVANAFDMVNTDAEAGKVSNAGAAEPVKASEEEQANVANLLAELGI